MILAKDCNVIAVSMAPSQNTMDSNRMPKSDVGSGVSGPLD